MFNKVCGLATFVTHRILAVCDSAYDPQLSECAHWCIYTAIFCISLWQAEEVVPNNHSDNFNNIVTFHCVPVNHELQVYLKSLKYRYFNMTFDSRTYISGTARIDTSVAICTTLLYLHILTTWDREVSCTRKNPGPTAPAQGLKMGPRISRTKEWRWVLCWETANLLAKAHVNVPSWRIWTACTTSVGPCLMLTIVTLTLAKCKTSGVKKKKERKKWKKMLVTSICKTRMCKSGSFFLGYNTKTQF